MRFILLFIFLFLLQACRAQVDLHIPDHVPQAPHGTGTQVPGTNVFISQPTGWELSLKGLVLRKDDQHFLQIMEVPGVRCRTRITELKRTWDSLSASDRMPPQYYRKEFTLGDRSAILVFGQDYRPGLDQVFLAFGDDSTMAWVAGDIPRGDVTSRDEVLKILLSSYIDPSAKVDAEALLNYTLDLKQSRFKFWGHASEAFYYTLGGKGDPLNNKTSDQIYTFPQPGLSNRGDMNGLLFRTMEKTKTLGLNIPSDYEKNDLLVNGHMASEITFKTMYLGRNLGFYMLLVANVDNSVILIGQAGVDEPDVIAQIKELGRTMRLK